MTVLLRRGACFSIRTDSSMVYALKSSFRFDEFRLSLKTDDEEISCLNESTSIARSFLKETVFLICFPMDYGDFSVKSKVIIHCFKQWDYDFRFSLFVNSFYRR